MSNLQLVAETRILRDVFTPADLAPLSSTDGKSVKKNWDRRAKGQFFQKLIDFVADNGQTVAFCSAPKMAAGLDASKINELLQVVARVASIKRTSSNNNNTNRVRRQSQQKEQQYDNNVNDSSMKSTHLKPVTQINQRPSTYTRRGSENQKKINNNHKLNSTNSQESQPKSVNNSTVVETNIKTDRKQSKADLSKQSSVESSMLSDDNNKQRIISTVTSKTESDLNQKSIDILRKNLSKLSRDLMDLGATGKALELELIERKK